MSRASSRAPVTITLVHPASSREEATRVQLTRLLKTYDLEPWLFTRTIAIDEAAIPHSHPVLTLHTKHLKEDDQLLSTFIHEQLHWFMLAHHDETDRAVQYLRARLPGLPVGYPDGADSEQSSYVHLPIILLEYEGLRSFVGEARANATFQYWEGDHYKTLYRVVRENREIVAMSTGGDKLVPPFMHIHLYEPKRTKRFDRNPDPSDPSDLGLKAAEPTVALEGDDAFNDRVLERLLQAAEASRSDSLLVIKDGQILCERYSDPEKRGPIETMSVTKSFVSLAIGYLIAEKKIPSLDTPLSRWFPSDFAKGQKAKITLRHVLTHTTGIEHRPQAGVLTKQDDRLAYVRSLPVVDEPGTKFSYNNEAVQLFSGIIASAAGKPVDAYLAEKLFTPLGIRDWEWAKDKKGNVATFYGLALSARDLAKVGLTLLANGRYRDREVIPADWVATSTKPARPDIAWSGMLWWIDREGPYFVQTKQSLSAYAPSSFTAASKLAPLDGRKFESRTAYWMEAGTLLSQVERATFASWVGPAGRANENEHLPFSIEEAKPVGFRADGWLGQYLLVYPKLGIVAVRQHREPSSGGDDKENETYGFKDFTRLVRHLATGAQAPVNPLPI